MCAVDRFLAIQFRQKLTPERSNSASFRTKGDALFRSQNSGVDTVVDLVHAHLLERRVVDAELHIA